jgi:hypothetical protein
MTARSSFGVFLLALVVAPLGAHAATITAKASEGVIIVYSTSKKPELCEARVNFTVLKKDGTRENDFTSNQSFTVKPGRNIEVWRFENPAVVAPLVGDITSSCTPASSTTKK